MVWLGHSIRISDNFLIISDTKMRQRFQDIKNKLCNVYQYIGDTNIRMKIWKTYVSPIVDWYIPVLFIKPHHDQATANKIEVFVHQTLCWTLKVSRSAPRTQVLENAAERPVKFRVMATAARLRTFAPRTDEELRKGSTAEYASTMGLRSGKTKNAAVKEFPNTEAKDLGDRMHILNDKYQKLPKELVDSFDRDSASYKKFDPEQARKWAKVANGIVQYHANRRRHNTL